MSNGKESKMVSATISQSVYVTSSPLFSFGRLWGLFPFSIQSHKLLVKLKLSLTYVIYSFILGSVLIGFGVRDVISVIYTKTKINSSAENYFLAIEIIAIQSTVLLGIFILPFRLRSLSDYIKCLTQVDSVNPLTDGNTARKSLIYKLSVLLAITTFLLGFNWFKSSSFAIKPFEGELLSYYISYYVVFIIVYQYAHAVNLIERRIKHLNDHLTLDYVLEKVKEADDGRKGPKLDSLVVLYNGTQQTRKKSTDVFFDEMIKVYLKICEAINAVNDSFGYIILVIILTCLVQLTIHTYLMVSYVVKQPDYLKMTTECSWLALHFCRLSIIVESCSNCLIQVKKISSLIAKLQCSKIGEDFEDKLRLLSDQLYHYQIEFSAFGLGNIDRSLITSFAGAVTTYLVIIIQFQNS